MPPFTNVIYLEGGDFGADGTLHSKITQGKPVLIMGHGDFCGHCNTAKPAYQQLCNSNPGFIVATVKLDGSEQEQQAFSHIKNADPSYRGVPFYLLYNRQGKFQKKHEGPRTAEALKQFVTG